MLWSGLAAAGAAIWLCILVLPWQPWRVRERLEPETAGDGAETGLADVTVLIPARDEAAVVGDTLAALGQQGRGLRVILVDDRSSDGTAEVARRAATGSLSLDIHGGAPLADGWTGKLWALEQGRRHVETPLVLLLDADITLRPGMVRALLAKRQESGAALVSVMAALRMQRGWERLLLPAFIFFFRLLYPFHLANKPSRWVAAAAGGCVLMETAALERIGGFDAIRGALIDDCALARAVKNAGLRTWVGVTSGAVSHRAYPDAGRGVADGRPHRLHPAPLFACAIAALHAAHGARILGADCGPGRVPRGTDRGGRRARRHGGLLCADAALLPSLARLGAGFAAHRHAVPRHDLALGAARLGRAAERVEGARVRAGIGRPSGSLRGSGVRLS